MFLKKKILVICLLGLKLLANDAETTTFLLEKPDDSSFTLSLKDDYYAKLKDIDIVKGEVKYKIFVKGDESNPVGYYDYINTTLKDAATVNQDEVSQKAATFNKASENQEEIKEVKKDANELDFSQFLVSVLTIDNDKINTEQTLLSNKITLQSPYSRAFKEEILDERALIFYIKFFVKCDHWLLNLNSFVFFLFIPYGLLAYGIKKVLKSFESNNDGDNVIERLLVGLVILFVFYLASTTTNQVSRTHFQTFFTSYIQESLELSTNLTTIFSSTFTSYQARNSGKLDKQELESILTNQLQNKASLPLYSKYFDECKGIYNTDLFIRDDEGFVFPKNIAINYNGYKWSERTTQNNSSSIPLTSLEFCHNIEAKIKQITAKESENKKILEDYQAALGDNLNNQQLVLLQKMQAQNVHDLGFLAAPIIASNNMFAENLNMFQRTQKKANDIETAIAKNDKNEGLHKGVIADSVLADLIELLPFMLIPGSDSIKKTVTETLGTVSSQVESLPIVSKFVSAAKQAIGIGVAIFLIKYVILYLPFVALILASFLVTIYYLISIILYLNLAPFLAAFAFAQGQVDQLRSFFTKGVLLGLKPLILVISIIISVVGLDLVKALNLVIIEKQFNSFFAITMTQNTLSTAYAFSDYGLLFLKGFIALVISIASAVIVFYVVLNGSDVMARILGIDEKTSGDTQSVVGNQVEQKTARATKI